MCWARGQNVIHFQMIGFLRQSFLEVHILTTIYQKAFILGPYVPFRTSFHSMTSEAIVHARGWARGQNQIHLQTVVFNPQLENHLSESFHTWTIGTL